MSFGKQVLLRKRSGFKELFMDQYSSSLHRLPDEVLLRIFSHMDASQLLMCSRVCRRWRAVSLDWQLWQAKLLDTLGRSCYTIVCPHQPLNAPSFSNLTAIHPKQIYLFLIPYINKIHEKNEAVCPEDENIFPEEDDKESETGWLISAQRLMYSVMGAHRFSLIDFMNNWWSHIRSLFSGQSQSFFATSRRPRFALFGPGFDHKDTNGLFRKMVDTRTKSFEPINMFTGHMGFGSGITLRLFAQAQMAAMDSSLCSSFNTLTGLVYKKSSVNSCTSHTHTIGHLRSCQITLKNQNIVHQTSTLRSRSLPFSSYLNLESDSEQVHRSNLSCCNHHHEDFTFELSYLYSLPAHLNHHFADQLSRLSISRLFVHQINTDEESANEVFRKLTVTNDMRDLCATLDGILYAVDARATPDQLSYLFFELFAVLQGFPSHIASHIPVVILYIMPKEDIKLKKSHKCTLSTEFRSQLLNRDSYSGAEYTAAWHDSLLLPLSALRLFELSNPWRLQKCSSNDIKTLIQGIMWLNIRCRLSQTDIS